MLEEMSFVQFSLYSKDFVSFLASTEDLGSVFREYFSMCYTSSAFAFNLCSLSFMTVSWLCCRYTRSRGCQPGDLSVS